MSTQPNRPEPISGWAVGGAAFAGCLLLVAGAFQFITGLAAVINDDYFVVARNYAFDLDVSAWGWIHLILGALLFGLGAAVLARKTWAVIGAAVLAMFSAVANFFFIPFQPFWSIVVI
ncbi:MAG: hypothetical protein JHC95_23190, partial [Solirubrobacteraceae bacterium]|nr:hypothetical protein [Solirubrobacteraceae bacterium]